MPASHYNDMIYIELLSSEAIAGQIRKNPPDCKRYLVNKFYIHSYS